MPRSAGRAAVRRGAAGHLAAGNRRAGGAGAGEVGRRSSRDHHDLRPRQHRNRGQGNEARGLRLSGKAALGRQDADRGEERGRGAQAALGERRFEARGVFAERDCGREHSAEGPQAADWPDGPDQWQGADLRRVGHRQRAGGARHSRAEPAAAGDVRRGQLRGDSRGHDRERAVRPVQRAPSPAPAPTRPASSRRPTAARCFWTKWAT